MSGAIALRKQDLDDLAELGNMLVSSGMFSDTAKVAQAAVKVLAGRELGLGPVESMRAFHIIEGKIEMSADLIASMVKAHPHYDYRVLEIGNDLCEIVFLQDGESLGTSAFSIDDAKQAGIYKSGGAWEKYPRNMLFARAMSNGVAWLCPDAVGGSRVYVDGEVGGSTVEVEGHVVDIATGEIVEVVGGNDPARGRGAVLSTQESDATTPTSTPTPAPEPISESEPEGDDTHGETGTTTQGAPEPSPSGSAPAPSGAGDEWVNEGFCRRRGCGHSVTIHDAAGCHGINVVGEPNTPGADEPCGCPEYYPEENIAADNRTRPVTAPATVKQKQKLAILAQNLNWDDDKRHDEAGVYSFNELTKVRAGELIEAWEALEVSLSDVGGGETDDIASFEEGETSREAPTPYDPNHQHVYKASPTLKRHLVCQVPGCIDMKERAS